MLWTGAADWSTTSTNVGSTFTDGGLGTSIPGNATAHVKGANTALLNGSNYDRFGIGVLISGANTSASARRHFVDILVDPAAGIGNAGSSWTVLIPNLYANSATWTAGAPGTMYWFPVHIGAGWALGARQQSSVALAPTCRVTLVATRAARPEMVKFGTRVEAIGATTASTSGVAVTPGTNVMGSYSASMGTLAKPSFWYQLGIGSNDTSMGGASYFFDLAAGQGAQDKMVIQGMQYSVVGISEQAGQVQAPVCQRLIPSGHDLYVRGACTSTPDSAIDAVAYAVAI